MFKRGTYLLNELRFEDKVNVFISDEAWHIILQYFPSVIICYKYLAKAMTHQPTQLNSTVESGRNQLVDVS